ncbi:hypothetical protein [Hyphomonas pacifica]|uniref:Uncharacterized protein n=1 Tax=Hyphomonas pacifica TaxID=1280941 RepID=A0A8B2PJL4_9PROT|nr:hypothetical protein [Hyphomonas pacifica]RAN30628.1 hypothetical protein HY3_05620 [Hyphomonas pacifica]
MARIQTRIEVWLATISHPDLASLYGQVEAIDAAGVLRVANWRRQIVSNGQTFHAAAFRVKPPGQGDQAGSIGLTIDNVDSRITYAIETLTRPPLVTIQRIFAHDPDTVQNEYPDFNMVQASWTAREVTASMGPPRTSGPLIGITNNPVDFPASNA